MLLGLPLCLLFAVSTTGACDAILQSDEGKVAEQKAPTKHRQARISLVVAPTPNTALGLLQAFSACARSCLDESGLATNKATCRLNCEAVASAGCEGLANKPNPDVFDKAITEAGVCTAGCYTDLSGADRETCLLICGQTVEALLNEPSAPPV